MTLATTRPEQERQNYNFVKVFNNEKKSPFNFEVAPNTIEENDIETRLANVIGRTQAISIVSFQAIPAGKLFVSSKYSITVKLTAPFANNFVLLRGLLEFSRPKNIRIASHLNNRTFEIEVLETQVDQLLSYIETILGWLVNELKFKETLKAIIKFESRVKQEQAILYSQLRTSHS